MKLSVIIIWLIGKIPSANTIFGKITSQSGYTRGILATKALIWRRSLIGNLKKLIIYSNCRYSSYIFSTFFYFFGWEAFVFLRLSKIFENGNQNDGKSTKIGTKTNKNLDNFASNQLSINCRGSTKYIEIFKGPPTIISKYLLAILFWT